MPEEDAFAVFVKIMQCLRLRELYKPNMAEIGLCMYQLEAMIQVSTCLCGFSQNLIVMVKPFCSSLDEQFHDLLAP